MNTSLRTRLGWIGACIPAMFSGCANTSAQAPRPLVPPALVVESGLHEGTMLTGPLEDASASHESGTAWGVVQRAIWVESPVETSGSLDAHVGLVQGPDAAEPVRPFTRYAGQIGFAFGDEAEALLARIDEGSLGRTQPVRDDVLALEPGTTARLDVHAAVAGKDAPSFVLDSTRTASSDAVRITLELGSRDGGGRERLVLSESLSAGDGSVAFVFRRTAARNEPHALVLVVAVVDGEGLQRATTEAERHASIADAGERRRSLTRQEAENREIQALVADLDRPAERRAALDAALGAAASAKQPETSR